jgi:UDP-N-acetylglucosamine 2-epimerase (non-hydrolysing)
MILICFGTRPEWLKIKPLISLIDRSTYRLLFTGQHPDLLKDVTVDYKIIIADNENRLDQLISDCLIQFPSGDFTSVLVQGDTASAFACAIAAFNRRLKIYYLEAGLRSYDLKHPYPEEAYRQMIARISDINFAPTQVSQQNLEREFVAGKTYVVGNTVLDNLTSYKEFCSYENKVLVTLHRRENHLLMDEWFHELELLAIKNPQLVFILPMHPNPNVQKYRGLLKHVQIMDPLEHDELLKVLIKCKLVISDSGGLQEESSFFNKKVIVCRTTTERPEAIETGHLHLCKSPKDLSEMFGSLIKDYYIDSSCPYGDGHSSQKILSILQHEKF